MTGEREMTEHDRREENEQAQGWREMNKNNGWEGNKIALNGREANKQALRSVKKQARWDEGK